MEKTWQLQDAKNRLSEVVDRAVAEGPQTITRRGKETVVIVSVADWRQLTRPRKSFKAFLAEAPLAGIDLGRRRDLDREIDLP